MFDKCTMFNDKLKSIPKLGHKLWQKFNHKLNKFVVKMPCFHSCNGLNYYKQIMGKNLHKNIILFFNMISINSWIGQHLTLMVFHKLNMTSDNVKDVFNQKTQKINKKQNNMKFNYQELIAFLQHRTRFQILVNLNHKNRLKNAKFHFWMFRL